MGIETRGGFISVDVERIFCEPPNLGTDQLAAEGKDEAVIIQELARASDYAGDLSIGKVDAGHLAGYPLYPDWFQHVLKRDPHLPQIGLVIAHPDRVPGIAVDD